MSWRIVPIWRAVVGEFGWIFSQCSCPFICHTIKYSLVLDLPVDWLWFCPEVTQTLWWKTNGKRLLCFWLCTLAFNKSRIYLFNTQLLTSLPEAVSSRSDPNLFASQKSTPFKWIVTIKYHIYLQPNVCSNNYLTIIWSARILEMHWARVSDTLRYSSSSCGLLCDLQEHAPVVILPPIYTEVILSDPMYFAKGCKTYPVFMFT